MERPPRRLSFAADRTPPRPGRARPWLVCAWLVLSTLAVYWPLRSHDFVTYDDSTYVTENEIVQKGLTREGVLWAFTTGYGGNWHPLTWLSHMLDVELFGLDPAGHHMTNLGLHIANTLLLFLVLRAMTGSTARSGFAASLFALHPLHVESVAWVAERKDLLSSFFALLTIAAYAASVRSRAEGGNPPRPEDVRADRRAGFATYLVPVVYALGLLSKAMIVTLPVLLLLLDFWPLGRVTRSAAVPRRSSPDKRAAGTGRTDTPPEPGGAEGSPARTDEGVGAGRRGVGRSLAGLAWEKAALFVLALACGLLTLAVQHAHATTASLEGVSPGARIGNGLISYVLYLRDAIWPAHLAVLYPLPRDVPIPLAAAAAILLGALSIAALRGARERPYLATGWLWYLLALGPVIGLIQVGLQSRADRYTYLPLVGLFVVASWGGWDLLTAPALGGPVRVGVSRHGRASRAALVVVAGAVLVSLAVRSRSQLASWKDGPTLYAHALEVTGDNAVMHYNLADALAERGSLGPAVTHYREAVRIEPDFAEAYNNLGNALRRQGKIVESGEAYRQAVRLEPALAVAHNNLGLALMATGRNAEAVAELREALRLRTDYGSAHRNLAEALEAQGRRGAALLHFAEAVRLEPRSADARFRLAFALARSGRIDAAISEYREVLRLRPEDPDAHFNLGNALAGRGRIREAAAEYAQTVRLRPGDAAAHYRLALAMEATGSRLEALRHYREALRLRPDLKGAVPGWATKP